MLYAQIYNEMRKGKSKGKEKIQSEIKGEIVRVDLPASLGPQRIRVGLDSHNTLIGGNPARVAGGPLSSCAIYIEVGSGDTDDEVHREPPLPHQQNPSPIQWGALPTTGSTTGRDQDQGPSPTPRTAARRHAYWRQPLYTDNI